MIGNGSSGVQVLPQLAKLPGTHIKSFQRSSNWVYTHLSPASLLGKDDKTPNPAYTEEEKRMFRENPEEHKKYRKLLIENTNKAFPSVRLLVRFSVPITTDTLGSSSRVPRRTRSLRKGQRSR